MIIQMIIDSSHAITITNECSITNYKIAFISLESREARASYRSLMIVMLFAITFSRSQSLKIKNRNADSRKMPMSVVKVNTSKQ